MANVILCSSCFLLLSQSVSHVVVVVCSRYNTSKQLTKIQSGNERVWGWWLLPSRLLAKIKINISVTKWFLLVAARAGFWEKMSNREKKVEKQESERRLAGSKSGSRTSILSRRSSGRITPDLGTDSDQLSVASRFSGLEVNPLYDSEGDKRRKSSWSSWKAAKPYLGSSQTSLESPRSPTVSGRRGRTVRAGQSAVWLAVCTGSTSQGWMMLTGPSSPRKNSSSNGETNQSWSSSPTMWTPRRTWFIFSPGQICCQGKYQIFIALFSSQGGKTRRAPRALPGEQGEQFCYWRFEVKRQVWSDTNLIRSLGFRQQVGGKFCNNPTLTRL